jgi:hypothetical protein
MDTESRSRIRNTLKAVQHDSYWYLDGLHVKGGGEVVWPRVPPGGETVVSGEYVHPLPHPTSLALPLLPHSEDSYFIV